MPDANPRQDHQTREMVALFADADDPRSPRRAWVEPESRMEGRGALASVLGYFGAVTALGLTFATGGAAVAAIAAALVGAGAGAGLGAGLGRLFDQRLAREFRDQIDRGGILVWVRVSGDPDGEARAAELLHRHGGRHVHVYSHGLREDPGRGSPADEK